MTKHPDKQEHLPVTECDQCGCSLSNEKPATTIKRQVIDIPEIKSETTEYQADVVDCPNCHAINTAKFPKDAVHPIQYGSNLKSLVVYMKNQNFIPYKRLREFFEDIFSVSISEGTFVNTTNAYSKLLEQFEQHVKNELIDSELIHCDESGVRIENSTKWVHVAAISITPTTMRTGNAAKRLWMLLEYYPTFRAQQFMISGVHI